MLKAPLNIEPEKLAYFYAVNKYVQLAHEDYSSWVHEVNACTEFKGSWRQHLGLSGEAPLDLEIGTGNGYFFEHRARNFKSRGLLGIELKYKPMIQTVKRTLFTSHKHFRLLRYDAKGIRDLFADGELNDVFLFFPDPWDKRRENKHRLVEEKFLESLFQIQKPGSRFDIKTDSAAYYHWICARLPKSPYKVIVTEDDLHNSKWVGENFQTHFEKLWTKQGRKTHFIRLERT